MAIAPSQSFGSKQRTNTITNERSDQKRGLMTARFTMTSTRATSQISEPASYPKAATIVQRAPVEAPSMVRYITTHSYGSTPQVMEGIDALRRRSNQPALTRTTALVVEDYEIYSRTLRRHLEAEGMDVVQASHGQQALDLLAHQPVDLILLDLMMPGVDGYHVLNIIRNDPLLRHTPVIVISGIDDMDSIARCIEMGAEDYLLKPFNPVLLNARITACMEKKRLRDQERDFLRRLKEEQERTERVLLNVLPRPVAERLKQQDGAIAEYFDNVTVLFADIVNFTSFAARVSPKELVNVLNTIFSRFDRLAEKHKLEKIKTIGDAYMVVGGLPVPSKMHAQAIAEMALDMQEVIADFSADYGEEFTLRIGIHSGPAVAGVIGSAKFSYDLWGDTVNTAQRMESSGHSGTIHLSQATRDLLDDDYQFEQRAPVFVKGKGEMQTFFLSGRNGRDPMRQTLAYAKWARIFK